MEVMEVKTPEMLIWLQHGNLTKCIALLLPLGGIVCIMMVEVAEGS